MRRQPAVEPPLTAAIHSAPATHDGQSVFRFKLRFSEEPKDEFGYGTLRDHAFTVAGGEVVNASRLTAPSNVGWETSVRPSGSGDVTALLPTTTDRDVREAICTSDWRMLSSRLELTVEA